MEFQADAVSADLADDIEAVGFNVLLNGFCHIAHESPRFYLLEALIDRLFGDFHELFLFRGNLSDAEHAGGVGKIAVQDGGAVNIDDVAVFQDDVFGRDAVANLLVDGGADALRISLVVQVGRNRAHVVCDLVDPVVDLFGGDAGFNVLLDVVENGDIDLAAGLDLFDLRRRLQQFVIRNKKASALKILDLLIESQMALLVFFAGTAPAGIISSRSVHGVLPFFSMRMTVLILR